MIDIPGYQVLGVIDESAPRVVLRARRLSAPSGSAEVAIKTLSARYPRKADVVELIREYSITDKLRVTGVISVVELLHYGEGNVAIVMEAFGRSLSELLQERSEVPLSAQEFFPLAIEMALILGRVHECDVVHKDVVPRNILIGDGGDSSDASRVPNSASGSQVRLIDFGISSELGRERQGLTLSRRLEGSLPYISPEQTGRMNRDLDYRSDYYSLGVTFFEMLTGTLPFSAESALEWVHRHMSEPVPTASARAPGVTPQLSAIIEKLMQKNAEDRYQSAFGLVSDLKRAQAAQAGDAPFALGAADVSRRFQIPQRLYGREAELEELEARFERVCSGETALCLISGFSGVGKSALANELGRSIVGERGYLIGGKFDQFKKGSAYSAVAAAFRALLTQILGEPRERLVTLKKALEEALGSNAALIGALVPELELLLGPMPEVAPLPPAEAQNRFHLVFVQFVKVFAQKGQPLVLFLDDLQWSDVPTLHLLQRLTTSRELSHLMIIGAYRDNAVDQTHPLLLTLDAIRSSGDLLELKIAPLTLSAVSRLVGDTLHRSAVECEDFTQAVFKKAHGNPLFISELLRTLHDDGSLAFDEDKGAWKYSVKAVALAEVGDDVVEFLVRHLRRLPESSSRALYLAACIGNTFDLETLAVIAETTRASAATALELPLKRNLVVPLTDDYRYATKGEEVGATSAPPDSEVPEPLPLEGPLLYRFQHDRVQQAAYELIDPENKQAVHLSIGRLIQKSRSKSELDERVIEVVGHLNAGRSLIVDPNERVALARLNLKAGVKAKASSAYASALGFFKIGAELLPDAGWSSEYELTAEFFREHQQAAYLTADYVEADRLTEEQLRHVRTAREKAEALAARTRQYATMGRMKESIVAAISGLSSLGVPFEKAPTDADILEEERLVQVNLAGRRIEDLVDAPALVQVEDKIAIELLMEIFPAAFLSGSGKLFPYLILKSVNISLSRGNSPEAAFAYAAYGMLLCGIQNQPALGYEYGKLAVQMNDRFDDLALKSRIIYVYTMFIHHFSNHWSTMTPWFRRGIETGYQSGDLLYLAYSAQDCVIWDPKLDLDVASNEQKKYLRIVKDCEYQDSYDSGSLFLQMQLNFQGLTRAQTSMDDESFNEARCFAGMKARRFMTGVANYHIYKTEICYFYDDFTGAMEHITEQDRLMASAMSLPQLTRYYYVSFLTRARLLSLGHFETDAEQDEVRARLLADHSHMKMWADNCPGNFEHLRLMMAGELQRLAGDFKGALASFEAAAQGARSGEWRRDEGQAHELSARLLLDSGLEKAAEGYLRAAHYIYYRWGARAKVEQMRGAFPALFSEAEGAPALTSSIRYRTQSSGTIQSADLDLASVIKASQAISGQIVLDQFWTTTLRILLENAGGQRGRFVVRVGDELVVQAETGDWEAGEGEPLLPASIINSALRTNTPIVLGDAADGERSFSDPYVAKRRPRSLICVPLRSTDQFEGAIYMENNVTAGAFSQERVEVIKLLSAQAVISVENAKLYENQLRLTDAQSRFVPSQFLEKLGHDDLSDVSLGQYIATEMTVLFADLRDFTPLAEQVGPDQVIALLNRYFSKMVVPITSGGGFIDSFIGDAIMALFGTDADSALRAAVGMHRGLDAFNADSRSLGQRELSMGVGLNTGPLVLGTVGSAERLKCGVVGDTVNLGSRIEQLTKTYGAPLLIGESTYQHLAQPEKFSLRLVDRVLVKGKERAVTLYEVIDAETEARQERKLGTLAPFNAAMQQYFAGNFRDAAMALGELQRVDPGDGVFPLLRGRAEAYEKNPPAEDWQGATALTHK